MHVYFALRSSFLGAPALPQAGAEHRRLPRRPSRGTLLAAPPGIAALPLPARPRPPQALPMPGQRLDLAVSRRRSAASPGHFAPGCREARAAELG